MPKILKVTSMQCLCNISRKNWVMKLMFCMLINMKLFYKKCLLSRWKWWEGVEGITSPLPYSPVNLAFLWKKTQIEKKYSITFDGFGQACPNYPDKFTVSLWHLEKEVRDEVRDLTALAGSNTTLTIYYTSNVLPPLTIFFTQYGIHTKPFLLYKLIV